MLVFYVTNAPSKCTQLSLWAEGAQVLNDLILPTATLSQIYILACVQI
jgi:hypothetical protein